MPANCLNRREALGTLALGVAAFAGLGLPARRARAAMIPLTYFGWHALERGPQDPEGTVGGTKSNLNVITGEGPNSLLVAFDGVFVLVDTKKAPVGPMLRDHFKYFKGNAVPPGVVINTHYHRDATGGNVAFKKDFDVIAHPNAIRKIRNQHVSYQLDAQKFFADPGKREGHKGGFVDHQLKDARETYKNWQPEDFLPTKPMQGLMDTFTVGTKTRVEVELYHFGTAHTDGDVVVRFPKYNVMHVGDLCFSRCHTHIDRGDKGSSRKWSEVLGKVMDLCNKDTIIVPGNGPVTDIQGLKNQIAYFDVVRTEVKKLVDAGKQRSDAEKLVIERFSDLALPELAPVCYGAMYDELTRGDPT